MTANGSGFTQLRVVSGFSARYGASHPERLAERAAERGMDALALTDRDGTYGAVKHAKACRTAGIRPILGVDLAVRPWVLTPVALGVALVTAVCCAVVFTRFGRSARPAALREADR